MKNIIENPEINKSEKQIGESELRFNEYKEEKLDNLIVEVIVSSTLREYYEESNKISKIQQNRTE